MDIRLEKEVDNRTHTLTVKDVGNKLQISANTFSVIGGSRSGEYSLDVNDALKLRDALNCFINKNQK